MRHDRVQQSRENHEMLDVRGGTVPCLRYGFRVLPGDVLGAPCRL